MSCHAYRGGPRQRLDNPILISLVTLQRPAVLLSLLIRRTYNCILYTRLPYTKHRLRKNKGKFKENDFIGFHSKPYRNSPIYKAPSECNNTRDWR